MPEDSPWLVCEGPKGEAFFERLISVRRIPQFLIKSPGKESGTGDGCGAIGKLVLGLKGLRQTRKNGLLIACDSDSDPAKAFASIAAQLADAGVCAPREPGEFARDKWKFGLVGVTLVPSAKRAGQLETLCLEAMRDAYPEAIKCGEQLVDCNSKQNWANSNWKEKVLLSTSLACACGRDTPLKDAWKQELVPIPLDHPCFDQLADALQSFAQEAGN